MPYKLVVVFKLEPGTADVEIERCRSAHSFPNILREQPGFISYEVVKLGEDGTMIIQTWRTKEHLAQAMPKAAAARARLAEAQENIVLSSETFAGEVALRGDAAPEHG